MTRFGKGIVALGLAAFGLGIGACSSDKDPSGPPSGNIAGAYSIQKVDGKAMPASFTDRAGSQLTFTTGVMVLNADGTYELEYDIRLNNKDHELGRYGTYTRNGSSIAFVDEDGVSEYGMSGTLNGDQLSVQIRVAGVQFVLALRRNG